MKIIRSFCAINLDIKTARAIAAEQVRLREDCKDSGIDVRWIAPQNMHITISFLGNVTEPMIQAIKDSMEFTCRKFPPIELEFSGLGAFPSPAEPQVIWVGVKEKTGALLRFHADIIKVLKSTGFKLDDKPFQPHVTIGRVKSSVPLSEELLTPQEAPVFGRTTVKELLCYRSDLSPKGADYYMLWKLLLRGRIMQQSTNRKNQDASSTARTVDTDAKE